MMASSLKVHWRTIKLLDLIVVDHQISAKLDVSKIGSTSENVDFSFSKASLKVFRCQLFINLNTTKYQPASMKIVTDKDD